MKLLYFPDIDVLSIKLPPDRFEGRDTNDPDVTFFFDTNNRISEILIENASPFHVDDADTSAAS